ncbi:MAG: hypothetical protein IE927_02040 [Rhodobacterales bacterium]|nr:hypothetical protein [Rhodobacterales bacterium]
MKHLRSAPGGWTVVGPGGLLLAGATLWLAPVAAGLVLLAVFALVGDWAGVTGLALWAAGMALVLSPVFSWIGWLIALPATALLLRQGWFGWLPAAALGAVAGLLAAEVAQSELAPWFGLVSVTGLRDLLGLRHPAAFTLPRAG